VTAALPTDHNAGYSALEALAIRSNPGLQAQLQNIDQNALSQALAGEEKTRMCYASVLAGPDPYFLMRERNIIPDALYWLEVRHFKSFAKLLISAVIVVILVVTAVLKLSPSFNDMLANYCVWRVAKANSTKTDQHRSQQNLLALMRNPASQENTTLKLTSLLREPALPVDRVDLILRTLLESQAPPNQNANVASLLFHALRADSVDVRTRVNDALRSLSESCLIKFEDTTPPWKPNDGDSVATLEQRIAAWVNWTRACSMQRKTKDQAATPLVRPQT
jgi:hypothetical protein